MKKIISWYLSILMALFYIQSNVYAQRAENMFPCAPDSF